MRGVVCLAAWVLLSLGFSAPSAAADDSRYECHDVKDLAEVVLRSPKLILNVYSDQSQRICSFWVSAPPGADTAGLGSAEDAARVYAELKDAQATTLGQWTELVQKTDFGARLGKALLMPFEFSASKGGPAKEVETLMSDARSEIDACAASFLSGKGKAYDKIFASPNGVVGCGVNESGQLFILAAEVGLVTVSLALPT